MVPILRLGAMEKIAKQHLGRLLRMQEIGTYTAHVHAIQIGLLLRINGTKSKILSLLEFAIAAAPAQMGTAGALEFGRSAPGLINGSWPLRQLRKPTTAPGPGRRSWPY